jgi:hypothetical protein
LIKEVPFLISSISLLFLLFIDSLGEGIDKLRRVLFAYSLHDPDLGYCQSMNFVVATLLLFVEEEEAFYLLESIIKVIPEYYVKEMLGIDILSDYQIITIFIH